MILTNMNTDNQAFYLYVYYWYYYCCYYYYFMLAAANAQNTVNTTKYKTGHIDLQKRIYMIL